MGATVPLLSVWQVPPLDTGFAQAVTIEGWEPEEEALVVAGIRVPPPLPALTVSRRTAGRFPEVMASMISVRLITERIRDVLARALQERVQFLPATVSGHPQPYFVPNVLELRSCTVSSEGRLMVRTDDFPPLFRVRDLPSVWLVRADLESRLRSDLAGEFVSLHQFRMDERSRYRAVAEDGWR